MFIWNADPRILISFIKKGLKPLNSLLESRILSFIMPCSKPLSVGALISVHQRIVKELVNEQATLVIEILV
jgi:hypothetical protein